MRITILLSLLILNVAAQPQDGWNNPNTYITIESDSPNGYVIANPAMQLGNSVVVLGESNDCFSSACNEDYCGAICNDGHVMKPLWCFHTGTFTRSAASHCADWSREHCRVHNGVRKYCVDNDYNRFTGDCTEYQGENRFCHVDFT